MPTPEQLREIYARLMEYPNVIGCYIGWKYRERSPTRALSIVCCVSEKVDAAKLGAAERIPRTVSWQVTSSRRRRLVVDVQAMVGSELQALPVVGPGDQIVSAGDPGTIGIALRHPEFGPVVTTAGHVVHPQGTGLSVFSGPDRPRVTLSIGSGPAGGSVSTTGAVVKVDLSEGVDYALVKPDSFESRNLYRDDLPLARPFAPDDLALDAPAFVLRSSELRQVTVRGVNLDAPVAGRVIHGAILTELATAGGDSGCCLVDNTSRVWGLLVGAAIFVEQGACSVFAPAERLLVREGSSFI